MTSSSGHLVTDEMHAAIGRVIDWRRSFPVSASDIRRWALAVYHPDRPPERFWAGSASDLIAPVEFNPFAWMVADAMTPVIPCERGDPDRLEKALGVTGPGLRHHLNGGMSITYGASPIRPGDCIRSKTRLIDYQVREGRFGPMLITSTDTTWRNQAAETVLQGKNTSVRYNSEARESRRAGNIAQADRPERSCGPEPVAGKLQRLGEARPGTTLYSPRRTPGLEQFNRFAAVNDEFVAIHMDDEAARRAGYPGAIIMGRLLWSYVHNLLRSWLAGLGRIIHVDLQFRRALVRDTDVVCRATVTETCGDVGERIVELRLEVVDGADRILAHGSATVSVRA